MSFNSINLAFAALNASSNAMQIVSNNVSNMNTTGFKGSKARFASMFNQGLGSNGKQGGAAGAGVSLVGGGVNLRSGRARETGAGLDVAVSGAGFFILKKPSGEIIYTRNGNFDFNKEGILVSKADGSHVQAMGPNGLQDITLESWRTRNGTASTSVSFAQGASFLQGSTAANTSYTMPGIDVIDSQGGKRTLSITFTKQASPANTWHVTFKDSSGNSVGGTHVLTFDAVGNPTSTTRTYSLDWTPPGVDRLLLNIDFQNIRTGTGADPNSVRGTADGRPFGILNPAMEFNDKGILQFSYSNGVTETEKGPQLALALFDSLDDLEQIGGSEFRCRDRSTVSYGVASDQFGSIVPKSLEGSNVELTEEMSDLITLQRAYELSSQIVSTSNEMIGKLLETVRSR